jgi:hypothetical protein
MTGAVAHALGGRDDGGPTCRSPEEEEAAAAGTQAKTSDSGDGCPRRQRPTVVMGAPGGDVRQWQIWA